MGAEAKMTETDICFCSFVDAQSESDDAEWDLFGSDEDEMEDMTEDEFEDNDGDDAFRRHHDFFNVFFERSTTSTCFGEHDAPSSRPPKAAKARSPGLVRLWDANNGRIC